MAKKMDETVSTTVRLSVEQLERLKIIKRRHFISVSDSIRQAVEEWIKKVEAQHNG